MGNLQYTQVQYSNQTSEEVKSSGYSKVIRHPNIGPDDQLVSNFEFNKETGEKM